MRRRPSINSTSAQTNNACLKEGEKVYAGTTGDLRKETREKREESREKKS